MSPPAPFNSPLECGLRTLILLNAAAPNDYDLQRLVFYDYLLVHSADAGGPASIHPATPLRSGEALVRRHWIERGLLLFVSRDLVLRVFSEKGITYRSTPLASSFLEYLHQPYTVRLQEVAAWVIERFGGFSDVDLGDFFKQHLDRWSSEFIREDFWEEDQP